MILECYQTLEDQGNLDEVERDGPFLCKRPNAWLGKGYYFWDSNIEWAHEWGEGPDFVLNGYIICQAPVSLDKMIFDLFGNVQHQIAFAQAYNLLKKKAPQGDILVRDVLATLQKAASFPFTGIRAADEPKSALFIKFNKNRGEQLIINQRVQICLLNKNNILSRTFRIVFPEKYVQ